MIKLFAIHTVSFVLDMAAYYFYWFKCLHPAITIAVGLTMILLVSCTTWYATFLGYSFAATYIAYLLSSHIREYVKFSVDIARELSEL